MLGEYFNRAPVGIGFVDGMYVPIKEMTVSIADLGFIQSAATYDVAHLRNGRIMQLDWHLDRFFQSAEGLRIPITQTREQIVAIIRECILRSNLKDAFIWIGVTRGIPSTGGPRDYATCESRLYVYAKEYYDIKPDGVHISISSFKRTPATSVNPIRKNHQWLEFQMAQLVAVDNGYDTTVLMDADWNISEGPGFNICIVKDGFVVTPVDNCLGGITTRVLKQLAHSLGIPFSFDHITMGELIEADEVF